jgi:hypothetical protein
MFPIACGMPRDSGRRHIGRRSDCGDDHDPSTLRYSGRAGVELAAHS